MSVSLRSPVFRKLLLSSFLPTAITLVVLGFYLTRLTAHREIELVEARLASQARVLAAELGRVPDDERESWAKEAGGRAETRVTWIDPKGVVLADSQHDPRTMENHANRPEVREAHQRGLGAALRHSATLNRDLCYVALRFSYRGGSDNILRLAVPLQDLDRAIAAVRARILGASLVAATLAFLMAYFFSQSFTSRITRLHTFAEELADAHFPETALPEADDELGALARSLNRTASELRRLVDRLSLESARRDAVLSSMIEGVVAVDRDLRVIFSNRSFAKLVGATDRAPEGSPLLEVVRDAELGAMLRRTVDSGEPSRGRVQPPAAEGRVFVVQAAPLAGPGQRGALAILHDVTELERLERVRKDFVANVSHELRTPLTAIQGYAETLLEGALEDRENNRRFVEVIRSHALRLNAIASDLLTLSELDAGRFTADPAPLSVREALEAAWRAVEAEAGQRGVRLMRGSVEDARVTGNSHRLEQALLNLLGNAVKFNRPGGEVRVEVRHTVDHRVEISIADNGIGIPSQDLSRIFERFYRVDKARSREVGGTGLGLSIVKHVIERMNGTVTVESELGKGSTFRVLLPSFQE